MKLLPDLVPDWRSAHKWASVQIASASTLLFALGSGLAASSAAATWINVIPRWAVFALAAVICLCIAIARVLKKAPKPDNDDYYGA
jgi:hypothetical protein